MRAPTATAAGLLTVGALIGRLASQSPFPWAVDAQEKARGETPGIGQRYTASYKDKDGKWLDGGKTYKIHVPANPSAKQFWSATAYDEGTRQMVVTEQGRPDTSSRKKDIVKNADGSIDVYFGAQGARGQGNELGADRPRQGLVHLLPLQRLDRSVHR